MGKYVIGLDFGSDSVRALVVDASDGKEISSAVAEYPRWARGEFCVPSENQYRQHPLDHIESMEKCVREALASCGTEVADNVAGISVSATASTPVLVDRDGTPLALLPRYAENPDAMFVLWKDHTAMDEADRINAVAKSWETDYTMFCGGTYSPEWVWAKMLHCLKHDDSLKVDAWSWTEHCDWISAILCGNTVPEKMARSRCAAGHKAMWHESWGGLPSWDFLEEVDPLLGTFKGHLYDKTVTGDCCVGKLCAEWAGRLGLNENVAIGIGAIDCHVGAVGAGITPGTLVKVMGTSTCDIFIGPDGQSSQKPVRGICGQVFGSVTPNNVGYEAGQSAFGDVYAWASRFLGESIADLSAEAAQIPLKANDIVALDWFNGRRTPDADMRVKAAVVGLTMSTTRGQFFKALVEATAFGSRAINERFHDEGLQVGQIVAIGGISGKSTYIMQVMSDVLGVPIKVLGSNQACALGAAVFASVCAGLYPDVVSAQKSLCPGYVKEYVPDGSRHEIYNMLYSEYKRLGSF